MAVAVGTVTLSTGAIGTTFSVTGLAFQPTWVALFWSGRATVGSGEADHVFGGGFATSTSSRRAYSSQSDHGVGTAATDHIWRNDSIVATLTTAGATGGLADLDAFLSDGFRLIIDDVFPAALVCGYICGDGTAGIVDFSDPAGTGDQDYNVGIDMTTGATDDKFVMFLGAIDAAVNTAITYNMWTLGLAAGNTPANCVLTGNSTDGAATQLTNAYCRSGQCVAMVYDDLVRCRASLTTWLSTGFRLNWAEVDAGTTTRFSALAVKNTNARYAVGDALTSTGTSNQVENTPYQPTGLLILSAARAASTDDVTTAHDTRIVGAATGPSNRWCVAMQDDDAEATASDIWIDTRTDAIYSNPDTAATHAVEGLMDIVSFDSTPSFTYVMDDADPVASYFGYLLFADAPSTTVVTGERVSALPQESHAREIAGYGALFGSAALLGLLAQPAPSTAASFEFGTHEKQILEQNTLSTRVWGPAPAPAPQNPPPRFLLTVPQTDERGPSKIYGEIVPPPAPTTSAMFEFGLHEKQTLEQVLRGSRIYGLMPQPVVVAPEAPTTGASFEFGTHALIDYSRHIGISQIFKSPLTPAPFLSWQIAGERDEYEHTPSFIRGQSPALAAPVLEPPTTTAIFEFGTHALREHSRHVGISWVTTKVKIPTVNAISLTGSITPTSDLQKQTNKVLAGILSFVGNIQKQTNKILGGTLSFNGALTAIQTSLVDINGTLGFSGNLQKQTNKQLSGSITPIGEIQKQANKNLSGVLSFAGNLLESKVAFSTLTGVLTFNGNLVTVKIVGPGGPVGGGGPGTAARRASFKKHWEERLRKKH